jgi:DNA-binding PadR family transcriptional regulator
LISVINAEAGWSILDSIDGRSTTKPTAAPKPRPALKRTLILQELAARGGKYATQRTIREAVGMAKSGFASALFRDMEEDGVIVQGKPIKSGHGNMALTYRITQKGREEVSE